MTWNQATPWAPRQDADNDGLPDAFDNHAAAGAHNPLEHENAPGVTWDQSTPWAATQDTDNDGAPDAPLQPPGPRALLPVGGLADGQADHQHAGAGASLFRFNLDPGDEDAFACIAEGPGAGGAEGGDVCEGAVVLHQRQALLLGAPPPPLRGTA